MHEKHRQRLKNRFLEEGLGSFNDHEVLELLLFYAIPRKDTNALAHNLLKHFSSLNAVFDASLQELCSVDGIGEHAATFIKMIPHFSQYYRRLAAKDTCVLENSLIAGQYVCRMIGNLRNEVFAVICLDAKRKILHFEILENGTVSRASVHPRKAVECAIRHNASSVILAHNHPSGTLSASEDDRRLTDKLCDLFESMDIEVIDHIIAAPDDKFISMSNCSLMPN